MSLAVLARKTRATVERSTTRTSNGQFSLNSKLPVNRNCGFQCSGTQPLALPKPYNRQISNGSLLRRRTSVMQRGWQIAAVNASNNPPTAYKCAQQHTVAGKKSNVEHMSRTSEEYIQLLVNQNSHTDRKNVSESEWLQKLKKNAQPPPGESCSTTCDNIHIYKSRQFHSFFFLFFYFRCNTNGICINHIQTQ